VHFHRSVGHIKRNTLFSYLAFKIKMAESENSTTASNVPSITVYWLVDSRADRILLLLEELELPYVIEKFDRGSDKLAPAELKKIHPLGKSPVIKDGDKVVAESGFIIDYLIDKYGKDKNLKPTNADDLFHYNYVCYLLFIHY
jgi:glutathione S-transferase